MDCNAFSTDEEFDAYVASISPKRELVCPITQEVFRDPVVAEDGHTYEKTAILRWFSMGRRRSPVTNSFMSGQSIFPNLAIQGMANLHREKLGRELLDRCYYIFQHNGACQDKGTRIASLLDAGAETTLRLNVPSEPNCDGNTCLLFLIQCQNLKLCKIILDHESQQQHFDSSENENDISASSSYTGVVNITNASGISCISAIEDILSNHKLRNMDTRDHWEEFLNKIKFRAHQEKQILADRNRSRERANEQHRERQRTLAATERNEVSGAGGRTMSITAVHGLGSMQTHGWGYFPSLAALQFQNSIPPPSPSVAFQEVATKEKLKWILYVTSLFALIILFFS